MTHEEAITLRREKLGKKIRQARKSCGKTLREAAGLIGVSSGVMSSYERGRTAMSLPELELFAYCLDVDPHRFWGESDHGSDEPHAAVHPRTVRPLRDRMIGALLRAHRREAGLTIRDLAEQSGFPRSRISSYELGARGIPIPELEILSAALGKGVEDYFSASGPFALHKATHTISGKIRHLPSDLVHFLSREDSEEYVRLAKQLSELPAEKLRAIAEGLLDLAP